MVGAKGAFGSLMNYDHHRISDYWRMFCLICALRGK